MYSFINGKKKFTFKLLEMVKDPDITQILSELNVDNLPDLVEETTGLTLLHLSAKFKNISFVEYLIHNEFFDINAVTNYGNETALMYAISNGCGIGTLKTFLDAGADLWNIKNNHNECALNMIFKKYRRRSDIMKLVMDEIEKRCSTNEEIVEALLTGRCQLYHLDIFKKVEITKLMIERRCRVNRGDPENSNNTALHIAVQLNDLDNVKILMQAGAKKFVENSENFPPIVYIPGNLDSLNTELVELLLPNDEDWLVKSNYMEIIFKHCKQGVLEYLVHYRTIDFNARDRFGQSPLDYSVANRDIQIEKLFKNLISDVNTTDDRGWSSLHKAVMADNAQAVQYLIDAGVNVNLVDSVGQSPLFFTHSTGRRQTAKVPELAELLLLHGAETQLVCSREETIVLKVKQYQDMGLMNLICYYLAIDKVRKSTLKPIILGHINSYEPFKNFFVTCKQELEDMKGKTICGSVTLFNIVTDSDKKIRKYARNQEILKEFVKFDGPSYFYRLSTKRIDRALEINSLQKKAVEFLIDCIEELDGYELIIENIVNFLNVVDWRVLATFIDSVGK